jgi:hypothetical protein
MEYLTVPALAQSLYDMIVSMYFEEDSEFEFAVNHLSRWMEPFESLEDIEDNVFQVLYKFTRCTRVWKATVHCSDTLKDMACLQYV